MLSLKARLLVAAVISALSFGSVATMATSAGAAPAVESRLVSSSSAKQAVVPGVNARKTTTSCNGENFTYGNITLSLGGGMWYYVGLRDGKIRMVRVYTDNGGNAKLKLAVRTWSGAYVGSESYGSSYCITFSGSATGADITGVRWGNTYFKRELW